MGKKWKQWQILFSWAPKSLQMVTEAIKLKNACSLKESYGKLREHIKKQRHHFTDKGPYSQSYNFSSSHVGTSLVAQMVKNLTAVWETQVRPLGWKDPLEKGMAVFLLEEAHGQRTLAG